MLAPRLVDMSAAWSLSARRAWIEIGVDFAEDWLNASLSARRAWIEIPAGCWRESRRAVALRKESVDRNLWWGVRKAVGSLVALRKESVDRNWARGSRVTYVESLSARRAWIEIIGLTYDGLIASVALRKESVDRNRQAPAS